LPSRYFDFELRRYRTRPGYTKKQRRAFQRLMSGLTVGKARALTIKVGPVVFIYANRDQLPIRQTFQAVYLCEYKDGEIHLDQSEHDSYQWLDYERVASVDMIDFLREFVTSYRPTTVKRHGDHLLE
jgi:hypothetical protein